MPSGTVKWFNIERGFGIAAVAASKNRLSRDFRGRSIFDFCNSICQEPTLAGGNVPPSESSTLRPLIGWGHRHQS
jgi:hypothetical protein